MIEQLIFYALAFIIIVFSVLAVTSRRIIRSALFLLFVLVATAGLYLLLEYHFLAMVQIAVYAGGIMILFIFSILLTNQPGKSIKYEKPSRIVAAALAAFTGLGLCAHIIFYNVKRAYDYVTQGEIDMKHVGETLMGTDKFQYVLPFELISILLLACIIGGIMIAKKETKE